MLVGITNSTIYMHWSLRSNIFIAFYDCQDILHSAVNENKQLFFILLIISFRAKEY